MYLGRIVGDRGQHGTVRRSQPTRTRSRCCRPCRSPIRTSGAPRAAGSSCRATCRARRIPPSGCRLPPPLPTRAGPMSPSRRRALVEMAAPVTRSPVTSRSSQANRLLGRAGSGLTRPSVTDPATSARSRCTRRGGDRAELSVGASPCWRLGFVSVMGSGARPCRWCVLVLGVVLLSVAVVDYPIAVDVQRSRRAAPTTPAGAISVHRAGRS